MKKSNRHLSKKISRLNRINFCRHKKKHIQKIAYFEKMYYDQHILEPTKENYVYRSVINNDILPFDSINRISYNPKPSYISRANLIGQGIGYYSCSPDTSIIEACQEKLKSTNVRNFNLTVAKWKIRKNIPVQIICHSQETRSAGTDLKSFYIATRNKRKKEMTAGKYRTWSIKMKFLANQFAKVNTCCENDYYISACFSKNLLKNDGNFIDGIIYPSIPYLYKSFNYAFSPRVFKERKLKLEEVFHYQVVFNQKNKYPYIKEIKSTSIFNNDDILW